MSQFAQTTGPEAAPPVEPDSSGDLADALSVVAKGRDEQGIDHDITDDDVGESAFSTEPEPEDHGDAEFADDQEVEGEQTDEDEGPDQEATTTTERVEPVSAQRKTRKIQRLHEESLRYQGTARKALVSAQGFQAQANHWRERAERAEASLLGEGYELSGDQSPTVQNKLLELEIEKSRQAMGQEVDQWLQAKRSEISTKEVISDQVDTIIEQHQAACPPGQDPSYTLHLRANGDMRDPKEIWAGLVGRRVTTGGDAQRAVNSAAPKPLKKKTGRRRPSKRADKRSDIDAGVDLIASMRRKS